MNERAKGAQNVKKEWSEEDDLGTEHLPCPLKSSAITKQQAFVIGQK